MAEEIFGPVLLVHVYADEDFEAAGTVRHDL